MRELISKNFNLHSLKVPSQTNGMKVFYKPGLTYVDSGLSCDTFNIIHIVDAQQLVEDDFTEAINYFRRKSFVFCIWISEENLIDKVQDYFEKLGVRQQNKEPGMTLDLKEYAEQKNVLHDRVKIITTSEELTDYACVIAANWSPPDQNIMEYFRAAGNHLLSKQNNILLLAHYEEGKPVAVVEMFPTDQTTMGIYGLATLQAFRGKGVGSSLLTFCLNKAKVLGYEHAILQASEDGIGIYKRLGFNVKTNYFEFA